MSGSRTFFLKATMLVSLSLIAGAALTVVRGAHLWPYNLTIWAETLGQAGSLLVLPGVFPFLWWLYRRKFADPDSHPPIGPIGVWLILFLILFGTNYSGLQLRMAP